jgi:hypothetical protein
LVWLVRADEIAWKTDGSDENAFVELQIESVE